MFIPLHDANSLKRIKLQYVTFGLIAANAIVFLLTGFGPEESTIAAVYGLGYIPSVVFDFVELPLELRGQSRAERKARGERASAANAARPCAHGKRLVAARIEDDDIDAGLHLTEPFDQIGRRTPLPLRGAVEQTLKVAMKQV